MAVPQFKAVLMATPQMRSESGLTFRSKQSAVWPADPRGRQRRLRASRKDLLFAQIPHNAWIRIAIASSSRHMSSERLRRSLSWFRSRLPIEVRRSGSQARCLATNTPTLKRLRMKPKMARNHAMRSIKTAIVVYGEGAGTTRTVCTDPNCPVHHPRRVVRDRPGSRGQTTRV